MPSFGIRELLIVLVPIILTFVLVSILPKVIADFVNDVKKHLK